MRVLVFGAGAIGQWLGGVLTRQGAEVILLARGEQLRALARTGGVRLGGDLVSLRVAADPSELKGELLDWLFLTVKAYQVPEALEAIRGSALAFRRVLAVQNGVGSDEWVAGAFSPERTFVGSVTRAVAQPRAGWVEPEARGGIALAPCSPGRGPADLAGSLEGCGFPVVLYDDWKALKWSKLILNMVGNAGCALLDALPSAYFRDRRLYALEIAAVREALAVVKALGVSLCDLPHYPVRPLALAARLPARWSFPLVAPLMAAGRGDKPPSLLLDLQRGRPLTEVGFLNGAVARRAAKRGLPAPVNAFLDRTLAAVAAGRLPWETYRRRVEALLEGVRRLPRRTSPLR